MSIHLTEICENENSCLATEMAAGNGRVSVHLTSDQRGILLHRNDIRALSRHGRRRRRRQIWLHLWEANANFSGLDAAVCRTLEAHSSLTFD